MTTKPTVPPSSISIYQKVTEVPNHRENVTTKTFGLFLILYFWNSIYLDSSLLFFKAKKTDLSSLVCHDLPYSRLIAISNFILAKLSPNAGQIYVSKGHIFLRSGTVWGWKSNGCCRALRWGASSSKHSSFRKMKLTLCQAQIQKNDFETEQKLRTQ